MTVQQVLGPSNVAGRYSINRCRPVTLLPSAAVQPPSHHSARSTPCRSGSGPGCFAERSHLLGLRLLLRLRAVCRVPGRSQYFFRAVTRWSDEAGLTDNQGGIWQGAGGLMSDGAGRIFVATGNGVSPPAGPDTNPPPELGDSVVRLNLAAYGALSAADFFNPSRPDAGRRR